MKNLFKSIFGKKSNDVQSVSEKRDWLDDLTDLSQKIKCPRCNEYTLSVQCSNCGLPIDKYYYNEGKFKFEHSILVGDRIGKNTAISFLKKSAELGCGDASNTLGNYYYYGKGVEQSYSEAIFWYKKRCKSRRSNLKI